VSKHLNKSHAVSVVLQDLTDLGPEMDSALAQAISPSSVTLHWSGKQSCTNQLQQQQLLAVAARISNASAATDGAPAAAVTAKASSGPYTCQQQQQQQPMH
jgi:hypothetical protein